MRPSLIGEVPVPVRLVRHDPAEPAELLALVLRFAGLQPALGYASACAVVMRRRMSADAPGGGGEQSGATPVRVPSGAHAIDSSVSDADRSTYRCIERACRWCVAAAAAAAAKLRSFPLRSFPLRSFPLRSFPLRASAASAASSRDTTRAGCREYLQQTTERHAACNMRRCVRSHARATQYRMACRCANHGA